VNNWLISWLVYSIVINWLVNCIRCVDYIILRKAFSYSELVLQLTTGSTKPAYVGHRWSSLSRPFRCLSLYLICLYFSHRSHDFNLKSKLFISFHSYCSSRPAGNDVIGIDLGTTNSCVSVMEGKVSHYFFDFACMCSCFLIDGIYVDLI
jgi:hypothetical protein